MRMKLIATLLLGLALSYADVLSAQVDSAAAPKKIDPNSPAALSWKKDKCTAKKLLKKGKTEAAIPYLEAGVQKKPKKKYFAEKLAPSYLEVRNYASSNKWYKVLADKDSVKHKTTKNLFQYALTQKYLAQYEQSIATFTQYRKTAGDDELSTELKKRATREILGSQKGIFFRDSLPNPAFRVKQLDANVNQASYDNAPRLRDNTLYFSSQKDGNSLSRIYRSVRDGKNWKAAEPVSENINVAGQNVGNGSFSADGNTLYYTECQTDKINKLKCRIYKSKYTDGVWEKGAPLGININDPLFSNTQPAVGLNKDGEDVLYFVSDRNPLKGLDLYSAKINPDGSFGKPHSLGSQINSKGDETSPYFDQKTKTLYFSSNGWINIGGQDVFKSTWDANGEWTEPENLGTPINSSADDNGFYINDQGTSGFVASNRPGATGLDNATCCDNIYQVETTKLFLAARGSVYEEKDSARVLADHGIVLLYDEKNGTELGSYNLISGGYFFDLEPKISYKIATRKDGYYDGVTSFNTNDNTDNDTLKYDLFLKKKIERVVAPQVGTVIGHVYYDLDQSKLRSDSHDSLTSVVNIMIQYPSLIVEVGGHTDSVGSVAYNLELSKTRADAVVNQLIHDKMTTSDRLTSKAYGPSQPVAPNYKPDGKDNPAGQALNRRTEFKVVGALTAEQIAANAAKKEAADKPATVVKKDLSFSKPAPSPKPAPVKPAAVTAPTTTPAKPAAVTAPATTPAATTPATTPATTAPAAPATTPDTKKAPATAVEVYKSAPKETLLLTGQVYLDKSGKRSLVNQAAVFLSTNEGGFTQKVFYVQDDGSYSFDVSRAAADTFKLVARKFQYESNEIVITGADLKKSNKPIDLIINEK